MDISIVIASKDRPDDVRACLRSIDAAGVLAREIIVIDQSAVKYRLPERPGLIHVHDRSLSGLCAARNRALDYIRGEATLFLDDDTIVVNDVTGPIAALFSAEPGVVGIQCRILNYDRTSFSLSDTLARIFEQGFFDTKPFRGSAGKHLRSVHGCAMAFRTSAVRDVRFTEKLTGYCMGEDFDFSVRVRRIGELRLASEAHVRHDRSPINRLDLPSLLQWRTRNFRSFFRASPDAQTAGGRLAYYWWQFGEILLWLRFGLGNPWRLFSVPADAVAPVPLPLSDAAGTRSDDLLLQRLDG
jgi:GT2 family glycosyltransferase